MGTPKKMKVAIYAGMFKENFDGSSITLHELTHTLLKNQIQVGVWGFSITPRQTEGLSLYTVPSLPNPFYYEYRIAIPNPKLKKRLEKFDPDLIHITVPDFVGISLMYFARKRKIPVLTSFHTDFPSYLKSYKLGFLKNSTWKALRWFYNKSQIVMVPTKEIEDKLKDKGIKNTKLWPRGVHSDKFNSSFRSQTLRSHWGARNKNVILYSGRFVWYKGLKTIIEVYNLFTKQGPRDVEFVLAGNGPIEKVLKKQMPDAHFPGYLNGIELSRVYASSDLFLFPSPTETFGNVVMEALSSGLPTVVSDRGGCKEIIMKSGAGLIARAGDPNDFYHKCVQILKDKIFYDNLRKKALEYSKTQTWDMNNSLVITEYLRLNSNKKGKGYRYKTEPETVHK